MKRENSNRVAMINTSVSYCDDNAAATAGIPQYALKVTEVKAKMVLVNGLNQIASGTSKGVTLDTILIREAMTNLAYKCANATLAYANDMNNNTLRVLVKLTMTDFEEMRKEDVDDVCQRVHDATNANIAAVVGYGIDLTDVTDLQVAIDLYRTSSQDPRKAIVSASQARAKEDELIREVIDNLLIGKLDVMTNTLRFSNNDYWRGYFQSRIIINLGVTTAKVRGTVKTEEDVPLVGVMFRIMETGTQNEVARVFTKVKGAFTGSNLPAGNFDFEWSFEGYETVTETNVRISAGKELQRKIVMEPSSGTVTVWEGNLGMGMTGNVKAGVIANPDATVKLEALLMPMNFFASGTPNGGAAGAVITVNPGMPVTMKLSVLAAQIGWNAVNSFLNVQNGGMMPGAWKVTVMG